MSCSCGDHIVMGIIVITMVVEHFNNYYCSLYPYLPFMIIGMSFMDKLGNGMNLSKWLGAIAGFVLESFIF